MSRQEFNESWLRESPQRTADANTIEHLRYIIEEFLAAGSSPVTVSSGFKKIESADVAYYWFENQQGEIVLACNFDRMPQCMIVHTVGKDPRYYKKPPFAGDLYMNVLADNAGKGNYNSIQVMSDDVMSDEGFSIWKRLFNQGHKISCYDHTNTASQNSLVKIKTVDDLTQFFGDTPDFRKYRFVLSEDAGKDMLVRSQFLGRWMRETTHRL